MYIYIDRVLPTKSSITRKDQPNAQTLTDYGGGRGGDWIGGVLEEIDAGTDIRNSQHAHRRAGLEEVSDSDDRQSNMDGGES